MRKYCISFVTIFLAVLIVVPAMAQIDTLWERSARTDNVPAWFGANTERGLGFGVVDGNARLYVASRGDGTTIRVLDAVTGDDIKSLGTGGVTGGTFPLNDVGVTADGVIMACNLSIGATFKVYKWDDEDIENPDVVIEYANANRIGDSFMVRGSWGDNTAEVFVATANNVGEVYHWTMEEGAFTADPDTIFLADNTPGVAASVGPLPDGSFYWNAGGHSVKKYAADGTLLGTVPGGVVGTGSNAIRYIGGIGDNEIFGTHQYGGGNNNARIVRVPRGTPEYATTYLITPTLGDEANVGGTGDVSVVNPGDGWADVFVLGTNNGIGAYRITLPKIGWANLQWPPEAEIKEGDTLDVYAQLWAPGLTDADGNEDEIFVEIGYNGENTHPIQWPAEQWKAAVFNNRQGNNYEYTADIGYDLPAGTYYYASRFITNGEVVYGGFSAEGGHFWNGTTDVSGELTVTSDRIAIVEPPDGDASLLQPLPIAFNMDTEDIDWEGYTFFPFSGAQLARIENPDQSGLNETEFVLEYTKPQGSDAWAGFFYQLENPINLTDESVFKLNVWSPRADIEAIMKLEVMGGPATGDLKADVTAAGEWVELVWDLSDQNQETNWDRVVVIMDLDAHPVPATETWYLDDFRLEGVDLVPLPLAGVYYIPQGDNEQGFENLAEAFAAINARGADGEVVFLIDDNLDETGAPLVINRPDLNADNNLLIKPAPEKTPTIDIAQTFRIDFTSYLTIDGSNGEGDTRDLTINLGVNTPGMAVYVYGGSHYVTIKNTQFIHQNEGEVAITAVRIRRDDGATVAPEDVVLENNLIGTPMYPFRVGVQVWGTADLLTIAHVLSNYMYVSSQGIGTFYNRDNLYVGNMIYVLGTRPDPGGNGPSMYAGVYLAGVHDVTVANNEIFLLGMNTNTPHWITGVNINSNSGTNDIYNNMIVVPSDFANIGTATDNSIYGITTHRPTGEEYTIYHNTIRIDTLDQTGRVSAIGWDGTGTTTDASYYVANNILVNHHPADNSYGIHWPHGLGLVMSDYNNIYVTGEEASAGVYNDSTASTLADWQALTAKDGHSISKAVEFAEAWDLRLAGASIGDVALAGTFVGVTHDIDGNLRSPRAPTMGIHEPVDLQPPFKLQAAWTVPVGSVPWLANDNTTRGIAYNPVTDHVLVVSRTGAPNIQILNAADGSAVGQLSLEGVSGGLFPVNEIAITRDGQIFSAPLILSGGAMNLYYWENEQADPKIVFSGNMVEKRFGDALGVSGMGADAAVYISGTGNDNIAKFAWNDGVGSMLDGPHYINVPAGRARGGIAEVAGEDSLWINGFGGGWYTKKIHNHDGGIGTRIPLDVLPGATMDVAYHEFNGMKLISAGVSGTTPGGQYFSIVDVTDPDNFKVVAVSDTLGPNPNGNGVGGTAFDPVRGRVIVLSTNNAVASLNLAPDVLEDYDPLITIAAARELPLGSTVMIEAIITRAKGAFSYAQDGTAGIAIRQTSGAWFDDVMSNELQPGDVVRLVGRTSMFRQLFQINQGDMVSYELVSTDNALPEPVMLTLEQISLEGRKYQAMLVFVNEVEINPGDDDVFAAARTYQIKDPTRDFGIVDARVPNAGDTEWGGETIPTSPFSFRGVIGQFHFTSPDSGFQLMLIAEGDIDDVVSVDEDDRTVPLVFALEQNFPNPFNPSTTIRFSLPERSAVRLEIYNSLGQRVTVLYAGEELEAGVHQVVWNGVDQYNRAVASGMYIYRIQAGEFTDVKRMIFLK